MRASGWGTLRACATALEVGLTVGAESQGSGLWSFGVRGWLMNGAETRHPHRCVLCFLHRVPSRAIQEGCAPRTRGVTLVR